MSIFDAWPVDDSLWPDPPWILRGNMLTVWYSIARADLVGAVHPDLLPAAPTTLARARLYEIDAETSQGNVPFNEVVLAYRTQSHGRVGEFSYSMWTDSETYLTWGREVYGWPLRLDTIEFPPEFWSHGGIVDSPKAGVGFQIDSIGGSGTPTVGQPAVPWITPRRRLLTQALSNDDDVLFVTPTVKAPGRVVDCMASARLLDKWPSAEHVSATVTFGFELEVGIGDGCVNIAPRYA